MTTPPPPPIGSIGWADLTVPDATGLKDFYAKVAGWTVVPLSMGDYDDYVMMQPGTETAVAGVCHARGKNSGLPPMWLIYITVTDLDARLDACRANGGTVLMEPRSSGGTARYAVITDPAGASVALFDPGVKV